MLISSMTSARHESQRLHTACFDATLSASSLAESRPSPMPAKECTVVPPSAHAAIPVEAVTKTASLPYIMRSRSMMLLSV